MPLQHAGATNELAESVEVTIELQQVRLQQVITQQHEHNSIKLLVQVL